MGKLFWKIFAFLLIAQVLTTLGVGIAIWQQHPERPPAPSQSFAARLPPPESAPPDARWSAPPPPGVPSGFGAGAPPRPAPPAPPPDNRSLLLPPPPPLIGGLLAALISAAAIARYLSRPIRKLRSAFEAVASGRLDTRIGDTMSQRKDELSGLGHDFDRMTEQLEKLIDAQRRLLHDVSHELRSPLARLQAAAGLLRQQPQRAGELVERIERDTARIDGLVGELLTLARLESGIAHGADASVDLVELIDGIVADARFEAEPKRQTIAVSLPENCLVTGDAELLHRAIDNLLRNALQHSPLYGRIELALDVAPDSSGVRLSVMDRGPGVPEEDRERIFAPFVRSEGTRARSGYGLGLAIVRGVAEWHGGHVHAINRPDGGLRIEMTLAGRGTPGHDKRPEGKDAPEATDRVPP